MAEFSRAVAYTFPFEGGLSNHPADRGGKTRFGITEFVATSHRCVDHPRGIPISKVTPAIAEHIYRLDFWGRLGEIRSQAIATKVFDHGVNTGPGTAALLTQRALVAAGEAVTVDGSIGPETIAALNRVDMDTFLELFSKAVGDYYVDIARNDLAAWIQKARGISSRQAWAIIDGLQITFLKGWVRRAIERP